MSRKIFNFVVAITGAVATVGVAVVTLIEPPYAVAINSSIGVALTAVTEICSKFVKE